MHPNLPLMHFLRHMFRHHSHVLQLCTVHVLFYPKMSAKLVPKMDQDEVFKLVVTTIQNSQKLCKTDVNKKTGKTVVISGAEVWNKAYKNRPEMAAAYEGIYDALVRAYDLMNSLSSEIEELKAAETVSEEAVVGIQREEIQQAVRDCLPDIVKETVAIALADQKVTKTYSDALKKAVQETHAKITENASKTLDTTIESALVKNQQEIIESTKSKADAENYEKMRKSRNIVIRGISESTSDEAIERMEYDTRAVVDQCGLKRSDIVKIFRAGRLKPRSSEAGETEVEADNRSAQRPIIVTMTTPELARETHKHGFGRKISESIWINPDLTRSERIAAWKARKAMRSRVTTHVQRD